MYKYKVTILWSEPDNAYIAKAPELPGCMADGITMKDALEHLEIIISEWIEAAKANGRSIPRPQCDDA